MTGLARPDLLQAIVAATRHGVEARAGRTPAEELERRARDARPRAGLFLAALSDRIRINVIAECKRRSPARGVLRAAYDPVAVARGYVAAGAAAVSVVTEPTFFDGALAHLAAVRAAVDVPVLRKDFIVSGYQLLEARAAGADAVLLIAAALEDPALAALLARANALGLAALVEVHDGTELDRAVRAGSAIVGVNNRNLRTLEIDLDVSRTLVERMPPGVIAVAESGLRSSDDLIGLRRAGYHAFLMGESLMTKPDPGRALAELMEGCGAHGAGNPAPRGSAAGRGKAKGRRAKRVSAWGWGPTRSE